MAGLVFDSINDLPPKMRQQVAGKLLTAVQHKRDGGGKYRNIKVSDGFSKFDSKKEYRRFLILMEAARYGAIYDLRLQQNFTLVEGFTKPDGERIRPVVYKADFVYRVGEKNSLKPWAAPAADLEYWETLQPGALVIEDTKTRGTRTQTYINKYKMMAQKGYTIREV